MLMGEELILESQLYVVGPIKKNLCYKHLAYWRKEKSRKIDNSMNPKSTDKIDYKA